MFEFEQACREREIKVDSLAARYVRSGMAPWPAVQRAGREIDRRRRLGRLGRLPAYATPDDGTRS